MQISLSSTFNLLILLTILFLLLNAALRRGVTKPSQKPCVRRRRPNPQNQRRAKNHTKPGWVKTEVLRLLALMQEAGCRTIAGTFNAKFASKGESVSKTSVAQLKKKSRYEWMRLRKDFRKPPMLATEGEKTFWLYSSLLRHSPPAGLIDHGSQKNLALTFTDKSAGAALTLIKNLSQTFGKPKDLNVPKAQGLQFQYG